MGEVRHSNRDAFHCLRHLITPTSTKAFLHDALVTSWCGCISLQKTMIYESDVRAHDDGEKIGHICERSIEAKNWGSG